MTIQIDRWVLAEAWLSNGLRLRWTHADANRLDPARWVTPSGGRPYRYAGFGEWEVVPERATYGYERSEAPWLPAEDMLHELAHWLVATEDERAKENFGHAANANTPESVESENRALAAERVIQAVLRASTRIVSMALGAKP